jgi:hypothetical protein
LQQAATDMSCTQLQMAIIAFLFNLNHHLAERIEP